MQVGALVHSTTIMQVGRGGLAVEDLDGEPEAPTDGQQEEVRQATPPREPQGGAAEAAGAPPLPGSPARAEGVVDLQGTKEALRELGHHPSEGWLAWTRPAPFVIPRGYLLPSLGTRSIKQSDVRRNNISADF